MFEVIWNPKFSSKVSKNLIWKGKTLILGKSYSLENDYSWRLISQITGLGPIGPIEELSN